MWNRGGVSVRNGEFLLLSKYESPVMIFWQSFRIENLAEFSYGSVVKVVSEVCKIHEKMIKSCMKVSSRTESERPDKFFHESPVRTI